MTFSRRLPIHALLVAAAMTTAPPAAFGQDGAAAAGPADAELAQREARLAERFARLEVLAERLAELSSGTQPRRAKVLRDLVARSREQDLAGDFAEIVAALERESYSAALQQQTAVQGELAALLELLLQEDRDSQIESDRKRIGAYLKELKLIIRMQRGVRARTDGGDDEQRLAEEQAGIADRAGDLGGDIEGTDGSQSKLKSRPGVGEGEPSDAAPESSNDSPEGDSDAEAGEATEKADEDGSQENESADSPQGEEKPGDNESGQPQSSPGDGQSGDGQQGQQSNEQSSGDGQSGGSPSSSDQQTQQQNQSPADRAVERIRQARRRMQEAQRRLEEAERDGAVEEQQKAIEQLEQAKADLERILRQLREEEMERTLVLLEARLRKMLEAQIEVYEETKKLDGAQDAPVHEREIAAARLGRTEQQIARDAERTLLLLREDGSSVAFPEAIEQARRDMITIADRLSRLKTSLITQGLEEDVIASLEETLAAMQQALEQLREQRARGGQQPGGGGGDPGEQPLVAKLAELRMIRALQARVNVRTTRYGALIEGEMAYDDELRTALDELAQRQQRIFQAAHDLDTDENR